MPNEWSDTNDLGPGGSVAGRTVTVLSGVWGAARRTTYKETREASLARVDGTLPLSWFLAKFLHQSSMGQGSGLRVAHPGTRKINPFPRSRI